MRCSLKPYARCGFSQGSEDYANSITELPLAKLTLAQLHQLADAWPAARGSDEWVAAVVLKMYPQRPANELSRQERRAFLLKVQEICKCLPPQVRLDTTACNLDHDQDLQ